MVPACTAGEFISGTAPLFCVGAAGVAVCACAAGVCSPVPSLGLSFFFLFDTSI